jgi:ribosomal protein L21E
MANLSEGDRVRIVTRDQNDEDEKSGMYYNHYAGLTGIVQKVYSKQEVSVDVELESLTREIRKRHEDVRDQMKTKWLDGLSEEGRGKLTEREKDFTLRYVILVAMSDLEKIAAKPAPKPAAVAANSPTSTSPPRKTLADLEAAEQAELLKRAKD